MKIVFTLILLPLLTFGQTESNFKKLIKETNHCLKQYSHLAPVGDKYYSISSFGLSKKEIKEILVDANYDATLSPNKDSIQSRYMIEYLQGNITEKINQIIRHPDFGKVNIGELITSNELSIVVSDDNKLFNFSLDEKQGGTYRSQISIMYYTDFSPQDSIQMAEFNSFFSSDGYSNLYTLETVEGIKYVLTGYVRGCSYCFETSVRLVSFNDNKFKEEFMYSVNNRDWNDGVTYNPETKTIFVDYHINDLTPYCYCSGVIDEDKFNYDKYGDNKTSIKCHCKFIFNGLTFELVEESWKTIDYKDKKE